MRWVLYVIGVPLLLVLGLAQGVQMKPVEPMPGGSISVGRASGTVDRGAAAAVPVPTIVGSDAGSLPGRLEQLVEVAKTWLTPPVPYQWGGCSRHGVDCSCLLLNVYAPFGIKVPRTTVLQQAFDQPVSRAELRVGDTLFFNDTCTQCGPNPTHEGMYLGNGMMIDAGDPVRIEPVYWNKFAGAGRPPGL